MSYKLTAEQMEKYDGFDCRPASDLRNPIKTPQYLQDLIARRKAEAAAQASNHAPEADRAPEKSDVGSMVAVEKEGKTYRNSVSSEKNPSLDDLVRKMIASREARKKKNKSAFGSKAKKRRAFGPDLSSGEPGKDRRLALSSKGGMKLRDPLTGSIISNEAGNIVKRKHEDKKLGVVQKMLRKWMSTKSYPVRALNARVEINFADVVVDEIIKRNIRNKE